MDKKLNKIIFRKLYEDLSNVQIFQHGNSIWFIDRDKKFWYLEYQNGGKLYWRFPFFQLFFQLFSMEYNEYEQVIVDWVEEVLNYKVVKPSTFPLYYYSKVEEVLNYKIVTPMGLVVRTASWVEEVLNSNVVTPSGVIGNASVQVEEVLNCKVVTPWKSSSPWAISVEEVLNGNIVTSQ